MTEQGRLSLQCLCERDSCEMEVQIVIGDSVGQQEQQLLCQQCDRLFAFPDVEREWEAEQFLEVVDSARRGDEAAKWTLVVAVETERRAKIRKKLCALGVRHDDLPDAHHEVGLMVYDRIERLRVSRAYFTLEARIVSEVSRRWRLNYRRFGQPLCVLLTELDKSRSSVEVLYE